MQMELDPESVAGKTASRSWAQIVARNFSVTMVSSVIDSVLRFVAYGYLARQLGPTVFGINSFMYTTTFFFGSLSDFGLRILGAREIAANPDRIEEQVSAILSLKIVFMVTAYVLMQIFVFLTRDSAQVRLLALIYGLSLFGLNAADWILMGLEQMHYLGIAKIIHGIGVFVLVLLLIHGPEDLLLVGGIEGLTFLLAGWFLLYVAARKVRIRIAFHPTKWKALFTEAFPLGISLVMIRLGSSLPVFALGLLSSDYEVGIYKAVSLLPNFVDQSNTLLAEALLPTLSRIYVRSEHYFTRIVTWIQKYLTAGGVLISVLGIVWMGQLLPLIFGAEFQEGIGTFQVLMVVSAVVFSNMSLRRLLPACHAQHQYAIVMTCRTVTLLILSLFLARGGSKAEAWAVLMAELGTLGLSIYFFQQRFPSSRLLRILLKIAFSGGVFALTVWLSIAWLPKERLYIAILAGTAAYGLVLAILGVVSVEDFELVRAELLPHKNS